MEAEYYSFRVRDQGECTMEKEVRRQQKIHLALAIAGGESIAAWAKENGVSERTAFYWAKDPKVRREVEASRRRVVNQAIGRLTGMTTKAVDGISHLAQEAESESVQLRAWRAILAELMSVAKFSDLEYRLAELEEQVRERTGHTHPARQSQARLGTGLDQARELSGRWSVLRLMPLALVPCPASRRAWHNLVKLQAQEPYKSVFGDDANVLSQPPPNASTRITYSRAVSDL